MQGWRTIVELERLANRVGSDPRVVHAEVGRHFFEVRPFPRCSELSKRLIEDSVVEDAGQAPIFSRARRDVEAEEQALREKRLTAENC